MHSTHTAFKQGVIEDTEDNDRPGTRTGLGGVLGIIQHGGMGSSIGIDLFTNQDIVTFAKYYCIFSYLVRHGLYHKHLVWKSTIWETIESRLLSDGPRWTKQQKQIKLRSIYSSTTIVRHLR
jgi:hypothetical protein